MTRNVNERLFPLLQHLLHPLTFNLLKLCRNPTRLPAVGIVLFHFTLMKLYDECYAYNYTAASFN